MREFTNRNVFWHKRNSSFAIIISLLTIFGISMFYNQFLMPLGLFIGGFSIIVLFFYGLNYYSIKWNNLNKKNFEVKLFWYSFIIRLLFVIYMYLLTLVYDPSNFPMELAAADSWGYHTKAIVLSQSDFSQYFDILNDLTKERADWGYNIYQSIIYKIFGPNTFPVRLLNCFFGALSVVLISRISGMLFSIKHAKLTGIIAMLFPSLIYFSAIQLKETLMILIVILIFYNGVKMIELENIYFKNITLIILLSFSLFYFRTVLAVIVIGSLLVYFGLNSLKKVTHTRIAFLLTISFGFLIFLSQYGFISDISDVYEESDEIFEKNLTAEAKNVGNISYDQVIVAPFIILGAFITPFPSFLVTEERQKPIVAHFQNEIVRNYMYYFALLGIILLIKKSFIKSSLLLFFIISYLYVLASSGTSFIDRFHLPLVPFIIITMSVGFIESNLKWKNRWHIYIFIIVVAQIAWTIFKLNIRGL